LTFETQNLLNSLEGCQWLLVVKFV